MSPRTKSIIKTLLACLAASTIASIAKLVYGFRTDSLAFIADGIHSIFDSAATMFGIISVFMADKPPDEGHPYGHDKFETIAALVLGVLLLFASFEVAKLAVDRFLNHDVLPMYSRIGIYILLATMFINIGIARYEAKKAKALNSEFLASDSIHNLSDFLITCAVLVSLFSARYHIRYVDAVVSCLIAIYLVVLSFRLLKRNIDPLVDKSVLDPIEVEKIASSVKGVLHCHAIRSRGIGNRYFLDLNIHLPGTISLDEAHHITHEVEEVLKNRFPKLVDVVIHTEPDGHPPCLDD